MAETYTVQLPDGRTISKTLPEGLSDAQIRAVFAREAAMLAGSQVQRPDPQTMAVNALYGNLEAPEPTLASGLTDGIRNALYGLGVDEGYASHFANKATNFLNDLTPVGDAISFDDARQAWGRGDYLAAGGNALLGAVGAVPGVGDAAARGIKSLDFPSQLNRPRNPTLEEMQRLSSLMDVPLAQTRLGNKLEWDQFGKVSPWLDEYADNPIAAKLENGEYVLVDGNHRAALALQEGRDTMPMYVIPARRYDPANAGRPSRKATAEEIDRLLSELGQ